jgi:hypothetical protein
LFCDVMTSLLNTCIETKKYGNLWCYDFTIIYESLFDKLDPSRYFIEEKYIF